MSETHSNDAADRTLWRQARAAWSPTEEEAGCPADTDLAAWLDGRVAAGEREALEGHLAGCERCLTTVREVRALRSGETPAAPDEVVRAALALIGPRPLCLPAWARAGGWALRVAASIAICLVAYQAGTRAFVAREASDHRLVSELSFGVYGIDEELWDLETLTMNGPSNGEELQ